MNVRFYHLRVRRPLTLVVYAVRREPNRAAVRDHLFAFSKYASGQCVLLNMGMRHRVPRWVFVVPWDLVVFHTTFLGTIRWEVERGKSLRARSLSLRDVGRVRAALPQDDFVRSDLVAEVMENLKVDHVFTPVPASEWGKVYRRMDATRTRFHPALTGYLDDSEVMRVENLAATAGRHRDIDVGYRAWYAAPWLGRHGRLKIEIARRFVEEAPKHGLRTDISTRDEDRFLGDAWSEFLVRCKYTLGVEGGASILDYDGSLMERTAAFLEAYPAASFEEVEAACFPGRDGELNLSALSPRHLEACASRTCQVLVRGAYNGVLEPDRHYLALEPDFSNLDEVLEEMRSDTRRQEIVESAYRDVVASKRWTYPRFIRDFERTALGSTAGRRMPVKWKTRRALARARVSQTFDRLLMKLVSRLAVPARTAAEHISGLNSRPPPFGEVALTDSYDPLSGGSAVRCRPPFQRR